MLKVTVLPKLWYCRVTSSVLCLAGWSPPWICGEAASKTPSEYEAVLMHLCSLRVPWERLRLEEPPCAPPLPPGRTATLLLLVVAAVAEPPPGDRHTPFIYNVATGPRSRYYSQLAFSQSYPVGRAQKNKATGAKGGPAGFEEGRYAGPMWQSRRLILGTPKYWKLTEEFFQAGSLIHSWWN